MIRICSKIRVKYLRELTETLASLYFSHVIPEAYLEPCRISMMEFFAKMLTGFSLLLLFIIIIIIIIITINLFSFGTKNFSADLQI